MKKTIVTLLLALVMVLGMCIGIAPKADAAAVSGTAIDLLYDDQKDLAELLGTTVTTVEITNQTVTSKDVDGTADKAVLLYENGTLYAVGTGTATLTVDGKAYTVTVSAAPISVFLITGHSVGYGQYGAAGQSVAIEPGQAYSSWWRDSLTSAEGGIGYGANKRAGGTGEYAINAFDEGQKGTRGAGSALAYNWNKATGDKVWVMNLSVPGACINEWLPGVTGWHYDKNGTTKYMYKYESVQEHFGYLQTILKNEIAAGHYTLNHMSLMYFSGANFGNAGYTDWTYDSLKQDYATFWEGLKKDMAMDIDGDGKTETFESLGIVPLWSKTDQTYSYDKLLNYYMAASAEYPDVYIATECYRAWAKGQLESFPAIDYPTQGTAVAVPESVSHTNKGGTSDNSVFCTEDNTHLSQVTYNAVGLDMATNSLNWYTNTANSTDVKLRYVDVSAVPATMQLNNGTTSSVMTPVVPAGTHGNVTLTATGDVSVVWPMYIKGEAVGTGTVTASVDGTAVAAVAVDVLDKHEHCACGGHASSISAHTCETVSYQAWGQTEAEKTSLPTASGNYFLVSDITLSAANTNAASAKVNLCLNGHSISSTSNVFNVKGTLSITDCGLESAWGTVSSTASRNYGGLFYIYEDATLNLYGGIYDATGTTINQGGIAVVGNDSAGTMNIFGGQLKGGAVVAGKKTDGTAVAARGGAIYIIAKSTVNMYGGTISGSSSAANGGSIYIANGTVNMKGGTITGGTASGHGGNIHLDSTGTFNMTGGLVTLGRATASGKQGGNINILGAGTVKISGGTVSDGIAGGYGGNICGTPGSIIQISGGTISGGATGTTGAGTSGSGGNIFGGANDSTLSTITISGGTISGGKALYGGNVYVDGKGTISGGTIKNGTVPTDNTEAMGGNICTSKRSNGSQLTITGGTISGGKGYIGGNIGSRGDTTISGGTISGGRAYKKGGNIYQINNASRTLTISGTATISGGYARYKDTGTDTTDYPADGKTGNCLGGNIYIDGTAGALGNAVISGGTITGGYANCGGNIYCLGTLNISGGLITKGTTKGNSASGGNIYQGSVTSGGKPTSSITMTGGTISEGYANSSGGNMQTHGNFTMLGGELLNGSATAGGNVRVFRPGNFVLDGGTVTGGKCRNLSANGGTGGNVFQVLGHTPTTSYSQTATLTIKSGTINGSTSNAVNGGTIHISFYGVVNMTGGTINGGTAVDRDWSGTHYPGRGGVFCMYAESYTSNGVTTDRPAVLNISGGTINGGTAQSYGGMIAVTKASGTVDINISGGTFTGGNAINGGIIWTEDDCDIDITGGTFTGGEATGDGGLFYLDGGANVTISGGVLDGGTAAGKGDGIYVLDANLTIKDGAQLNGAGTNLYVENTAAAASVTFENITDNLIIVDATDKTAAFAASATDCSAAMPCIDENYKAVWADGKLSFAENAAGSVAAVYEGTEMIVKYPTFDGAAKAAMNGVGYVKLLGDTESSFNVDGTLWLDLNGFDLTGITVSGILNGFDSTTDSYSDENVGVLTATVTGEGKIVTHNKATADRIGAVRRYMAIPGENNTYTFHRFYLGITKVTLKPSKTGVGYKATFAGSDSVKNYMDSYGYTMWVNEESKLTKSKAAESFVSMADVTLRIDNILTPGKDEQNAINAQMDIYGNVFIKLSSGETIESTVCVYNFRDVMEMVAKNYASFGEAQQQAVDALHAIYMDLMKTWDIPNLHHAEGTDWVAVDEAGFKALISSNTISGTHKVYLTEDVTLTSTIRILGDADLSICLNGHNIHGKQKVFNVNGTLSIYDCCDGGDHPGQITSASSSYYGNIIYTYRGSVVNLYGGELVETDGGIIALGNDASDHSTRTDNTVLNIYGGKIYGGVSSKNGGNITAFHGGTINMYGGEVFGGTAAAGGGNICVTSSSGDPGDFYLNIYGGKIYGGIAGTIGGNIYTNNRSHLNIEGGEIYGGRASENGGNIYVATTEMQISGGTIANGSANNGGNIYSVAPINEITGGTITGGQALIQEAFDTTYNTGGLGGNLYLGPDSQSTSQSITGGTITNGKATDGGNIYIRPSSSQVEVNIRNVTLSGGEAYHDGGNLAFLNYGTVNLDNVTVTGGIAGSDGANIYLFRDMNQANFSLKFPTMNINGGKIVNGKAEDKGSGLYVQEGILTLIGNVQLTGNESTNLYLDAGQQVELEDLAETAKIGVSMNIAGQVSSDLIFMDNLVSDDENLKLENVNNVIKLTGGLTANVPELTGYSVGWYRGDITPQWEVTLDGMGNNYGRMAKWEIKTELMAGVTVIADETGIENAIVLVSVDTLFIQKELSGNLSAAISDATGIPANRIFYSGSHTHCGVDHDGIYEGTREYLEDFYYQMTQYAVLAVEDLKPATIQVGSIDVISQEGNSLNMSRRYIGDDGNAYSSVDSSSYPAPSGALRESGSDTELQLIRFVRENGTDIVMTNYQSHPSGWSSSTNGYVSAEHWKIFRDQVEADMEDVVCTFFLGASGNVSFNATTALSSFTDPNGTTHAATNWTGRGQAIAGFATYALNNIMTAVEPGTLKVANFTFETNELYRTSNPSNSKGTYGDIDMDLNVITIGGNIAFVTTPYEPFHENGSQIKAYAETLGFDTCFVLTNSMGENKYIAAYNSFENDETDGQYTSFGVRTCRFVKGTGELLMDQLADMLADLAGVTPVDTIYESYTVKVVDANGNAIQNVMVQLIGGNDARNCTDENGEIDYWLYGGLEYAIELVKVPSGYTITDVQYKFDSNNQLTITLN